MTPEKFFELIRETFKDLRPEKKEMVVNGMIMAFQKAMNEQGVHLDIIEKRNKDFPPEMEKFIDMLSGKLPGANIEVVKLDLDEMSKELGDSKGKIVIDDGPKSIGDTVKLTCPASANYMVDQDTEELISRDKDYSNMEAIYINEGLNLKFKCANPGCDTDHIANSAIFFPDVDETYYIDSDLIRVV